MKMKHVPTGKIGTHYMTLGRQYLIYWDAGGADWVPVEEVEIQ